MQQIDSRQIEKFLREEWEKVVAGIAVIVFLVLAGMALLGGTPYSISGSGTPPPARKPLLNVKSSFEFLGPVPEAGTLKGLELTAQVGTYTPPTCPACRHAPPHQPGLCQTQGCNCGKVVTAPPVDLPPPPAPVKPKITRFDAGVSTVESRLAFFSAEAMVPDGGHISQWKIEFGDGEEDTSNNGWGGKEIRHKYGKDGQFTAILSCRSDRGVTAQKPIVVTIGGAGGGDVPVAAGQTGYKLTFMSYSNLNGYITVSTKIVNPTTNDVIGKTFSLRETQLGITLEKADAVQATFKGADGKSIVIKKSQSATIPGVIE